MGPTLFPTVFWCDRGCGSDTPSRRKAYRGCHARGARKRAWFGSLSPWGPSLSFGVGLRLDAFFRAYPSKSGSVNLPSLSGEIPHGHGWNAPPKVRFAADSAPEGTGFELAVPLRWTRYGVRSLKRRLDRRGMTSGAARNGLRCQLVLLRNPFHASDGPFKSGGLRRAVP